jgi:hypothetical protein
MGHTPAGNGRLSGLVLECFEGLNASHGIFCKLSILTIALHNEDFPQSSLPTLLYQCDTGDVRTRGKHFMHFEDVLPSLIRTGDFGIAKRSPLQRATFPAGGWVLPSHGRPRAPHRRCERGSWQLFICLPSAGSGGKCSVGPKLYATLAKGREAKKENRRCSTTCDPCVAHPTKLRRIFF